MTTDSTQKVTEKERFVLMVLAEDYDSSGWGENGFYNFKGIGQQLERMIKEGAKVPIMFPLEESGRKEIRKVCRSLKRKGLAEFQKALWSDDGPAGAGYGATEKGAAVIKPCDKCEELALFDWYDEEDKHFSFCEEHYGLTKSEKKIDIKEETR